VRRPPGYLARNINIDLVVWIGEDHPGGVKKPQPTPDECV
jgi:hypothetical protein